MIVTVITAQFFHDGLRRRVREAGADYFLYREDIVRTDLLARAVLDPASLGQRWSEDMAARENLLLLGLDSDSRVNEFIGFVDDTDLTEVIDPRKSSSAGHGKRSRWWSRIRHEASDVGRIRPVTREGNAPSRDQRAASLSQLRNIYEWATKVRRRN